LVVAPIAVVAFLVIGFWDFVPVTLSFSRYAFVPQGACYGTCGLGNRTTFPSGPTVTVHWSDVSGGTVAFGVIGPGTGWVCMQGGSSGTCSFVSVGGEYVFFVTSNESSQLVEFTASYYTSLL
jgi:hypothetical protein